MKIVVVGAGSWGTTLADLLSRNGNDVTLWAREAEIVSEINGSHFNPIYVSGHRLSERIKATADPEMACFGAEVCLMAVPSGFLRKVTQTFKPFLGKVKAVINASKGFDRVSGQRLSQVVLQELAIEEASPEDIVVSLSGPNLADEVISGKIGAAVLASPDHSLASMLQHLFSTRFFRVYSHTDRKGVELGGTLKNIFAIGAGIVDGLGLGDNAKAAYMTRSLHEMVRLGTSLGGRPATFYGLSGLGDLMATASSPLSRNHRLGQSIARDENFSALQSSSKMVFEGVDTARMAREWGKKLTIPLPITEEVCRVLFEGLPPVEAAENLMTRSLKGEED